MAETIKDIKTSEGGHRKERRIYVPAVDVIETANNILVIADMPGVDEKSVDITVEKDLLTIYGMIDTPVSHDLGPAVAEYGIGDYRRAFSLSDEIDSEKIKASFKDGVLKLVLPKSDKVRTRKIQVISEA
ncbi:MAG: Hsp20/alpha crystallin family protein [Nitrospiraceae bacterium]|nr:MAG: Hsp20/alpha crystallin family protein [Nitrospiraceae bacterium]